MNTELARRLLPQTHPALAVLRLARADSWPDGAETIQHVPRPACLRRV